MILRRFIYVALLATTVSVENSVHGFTIDSLKLTRKNSQGYLQQHSSLHETSDSHALCEDAKPQINRRASLSVLTNIAFTTAGALAVNPLPSAAASSKDGSYPQAESDKNKIVQGYKRLDYLLKNWEKETTICKRNDNPYQGCDRTPEKVMEYLGYKSMEDPLFRADKTMIRLQALVPANDVKGSNDFQDAIDIWTEKAEEGNGMAYISSWGEANPGGGRDRVALFIERSRKDVEEAKGSLATVIRVLKLNVD